MSAKVWPKGQGKAQREGMMRGMMTVARGMMTVARGMMTVARGMMTVARGMSDQEVKGPTPVGRSENRTRYHGGR
jgi:hypothetical protein